MKRIALVGVLAAAIATLATAETGSWSRRVMYEFTKSGQWDAPETFTIKTDAGGKSYAVEGELTSDGKKLVVLDSMGRTVYSCTVPVVLLDTVSTSLKYVEAVVWIVLTDGRTLVVSWRP